MMEATVEPRSLKFTLKLKRRGNVGNSSTTADDLNGEHGTSNSVNLPRNQATASEDRVDLSSEGVENHGTRDEGYQVSDDSNYQMVLYDPAANGGNAPDPATDASPSRRLHPFADRTPRVLPSVGAFTVQCAYCFKWRLIPTKEKYEEIREHIVEQPFVCETAQEWRPDLSCDDPPDIEQDGSRLWAIDKPNISQPPPGWQRLLRIRGEGSTKFADVYYVAPSGKRLRSMVEIQKYLDEHPQYNDDGVSLSKFSFQIPKPLQENYVRKRSVRAALPNDAGDRENPGYLPSPEVNPISWVTTDVDTELQLSTKDHFEAPASSEAQSAKKRKKASSWSCNDN
ncbi:hypothetical protein ACS0TY_024526 [Phlomoides rotata]